MLDLVIRGGLVVVGTGTPGYGATITWIGNLAPGRSPTALRLQLPGAIVFFGATWLFVLEQDGQHQSNPSPGDEQKEKENESKSGIPQNPERRVHAHQHRRADDQCCQEKTERDPVGDLLKPRHEANLVDRVDLHFEHIICYRIENPVHAAR
jgi:hypothetical protein